MEALNIFGNDYDTPDGTCIRDYTHVVDVAHGHVAALNKLNEGQIGFSVYNLGRGCGHSVLEVLKEMEIAVGNEIPYNIVPRRKGDIPCNYADPSLAQIELKWKATRGLDQMCKDAWKFQSMNPMGIRPPICQAKE